MKYVLQVVVILLMLLGLGWAAGGDALPIWGITGVLFCALVSLIIQIVVFIPSRIAQTERFFDLTGGLTYITVVFVALGLAYVHDLVSVRRLVLACMVVIWAGRLSTFLFWRIHRAGKDGRFDDIKTHTLRFLIAWVLQALWVFLTALPVFVMLTDAQVDPSMGLWEGVGWTLWGMGFFIEVVADQQKTAFNAKAENQGRWIDQGLWAYSQHPNYFGEILLWTGICVSGFGVYSGSQWLSLLSPLFVFVLLTRISGIPLLRVRADAKWGEDAEYRAYRNNTSVLVPWFRRSP